ncbi:MAG: hypothetical protein AAF656_06265, partial [Planctomycetota bacterium]
MGTLPPRQHPAQPTHIRSIDTSKGLPLSRAPSTFANKTDTLTCDTKPRLILRQEHRPGRATKATPRDTNVPAEVNADELVAKPKTFHLTHN